MTTTTDVILIGGPEDGHIIRNYTHDQWRYRTPIPIRTKAFTTPTPYTCTEYLYQDNYTLDTYNRRIFTVKGVSHVRVLA